MEKSASRPTLKDHLQEHALKYNVKLHDVYHAVLGEQGKGGLCDEVDKIKSDLSAADGAARGQTAELVVEGLVR